MSLDLKDCSAKSLEKELEHERAQLLKHWGSIKQDALLKMACRVGEEINKNGDQQGHYVRQFHNILGYKAGGSLESGGVCLGCLYRSKEFIELEQEKRTGSKKPEEGFTKVHLEHTIPVAVLVRILRNQLSANQSHLAESIKNFLLSNSITTAMLEPQGRIFRGPHGEGVIVSGLSSHSRVFDEGNDHFDRPFKRYTGQKDDPVIFNVLTGKRICVHAFTMKDFHNDLAALRNEVGWN